MKYFSNYFDNLSKNINKIDIQNLTKLGKKILETKKKIKKY